MTFRRVVWFVALGITLFGIGSTARAIDYDPSWVFSLPLDQQDPAIADRDLLIYRSQTGQLIYDNGGDGSWSPPNLASRNGLFSLRDGELNTVPLVYTPPSFLTDETIGGEVIPGSNGIHLDDDPWAFWPETFQSRSVLEQWGLEAR